MVMLDRGEKGLESDGSALREVSRKYGFPTGAIVSMKEVIAYLKEKGELSEELLTRIDAYYKEYGAKEEV